MALLKKSKKMAKNFGIYVIKKGFKNLFLLIKYIMNNMYISELQSKEIISMVSGQSFGHIVDVEIDNNGSIVSFVAESKKMFRRPFHQGEITFSFSDIEKVGKDVILVRV